MINKRLRDHKFCTLEIIRNLDELESLTDEKVDLSILEKIIKDSPIYVQNILENGRREIDHVQSHRVIANMASKIDKFSDPM